MHIRVGSLDERDKMLDGGRLVRGHPSQLGTRRHQRVQNDDAKLAHVRLLVHVDEAGENEREALESRPRPRRRHQVDVRLENAQLAQDLQRVVPESWPIIITVSDSITHITQYM